MPQDGSRPQSLETKLASLATKMVSGLPARAEALRRASRDLAEEATSARLVEARRLAHRLAGIAGSHGYHDLTSAARETEALITEATPVDAMAAALDALAEACDAVHQASQSDATDAPPPEAAPQDAPDVEPPDAEAPLARGALSILAIEDDEAGARLLRLTLGQVGGFESEVVESAEAAIELLGKRTFDLVLIDAMMPGMSGLEFCRYVRQTFPELRMPLVIFSAADAKDLGWNLDDECDFGPDGWIRKPISAHALIDNLEPYLL